MAWRGSGPRGRRPEGARGPPAQRPPGSRLPGLCVGVGVGVGGRGHGGQREAEAGGEAPEDAAGHDGAPAQPQVLRLRPARPHLRQHDGRLLRLHLLLRQPARVKSTAQGEIYLYDNIHTTGN